MKISDIINLSGSGFAEENNQFVYISDSLGSSVIFDTLKKMEKTGTTEEKLVAPKFAGLSRTIYMNANQLLLIELGRIDGPKAGQDKSSWLSEYPCHDNLGGLRGFVETRSKSGIAEQELKVIAFTDPNDALSYYLTTRFKENCEKNGNIRIVNVELTNAEWNWLFVFAHPGKAHASGFKENDRAIDILVNGCCNLTK